MRRVQILPVTVGVVMAAAVAITGTGSRAAGALRLVAEQQSTAEAARTITLITGDRVRYVSTASGVRVVGSEAPVGADLTVWSRNSSMGTST